MKSFFHYYRKKTWIDFDLGSLYNLFFPLCSWEVIAFFSEQESLWSFLPNGAKSLRLEHEPAENLIGLCKFVIIYKIWMIILKISGHYLRRIRRNHYSKLARSDWKLWKWGFKKKFTWFLELHVSGSTNPRVVFYWLKFLWVWH